MKPDRIYNIPANYNFLNSLADWLIAQFPSQEVNLFLANKRSVVQFEGIAAERKFQFFKLRTVSELLTDSSRSDRLVALVNQLRSEEIDIFRLEDLIEKIEKEGIEFTSDELPLHIEELRNLVLEIAHEKKSDFKDLKLSGVTIVALSSANVSTKLIEQLRKIPQSYVVLWGESSAINSFGEIAPIEFDRHQLRSNLRAEYLNYYEAANKITEAKTIALTLRDFTLNQKPEARAALITDSQELKELTKLELARLEVPFADKDRQCALSKSKLLSLMLLLAEVVANDFDSVVLLSILKHPLVIVDSEIVNEFELEILRKSRAFPGLKGIMQMLEKNKSGEWFSDFLTKLSLLAKADSTFSDYLGSLIKTIEAITGQVWEDLVVKENAAQEIKEWFEILLSKEKLNFRRSNHLQVLKDFLSKISYYEESVAPIELVSYHEAQLGNWDLVILGGLNEGEFPRPESWSEKMLAMLTNAGQKRAARYADYFANHLGNAEVLLTRSITDRALITSPSTLLLQLLAKLKKTGARITDDKFTKVAPVVNKSATNSVPNPKPALALRPKKFNITEIAKLIDDPYFIYVKKILKLSELTAIDYQAGAKEFGQAIHGAARIYLTSNLTEDEFKSKALAVFKQYFLAEELTWLTRFELALDKFLQIEKELKAKYPNSATKVEVAVDYQAAEDTIISGRIDRIIFTENGIGIFDYKTGAIPTKAEVKKGEQLGLLIAALAATRKYGAKIKELSYLDLKPSSSGEIMKIAQAAEAEQILKHTEENLAKLLKRFADESNGYELRTDAIKPHELGYKHLVRA